MVIQSNIYDTALIFEGGGMRASYTAGFVNQLLENELYFDYVAGISAGASHSVNYLSRDQERTRKSFVELVKDPNFGGWGSLIKGEGYFRAKYIYEDTPHKNAALPLDFETFMDNPAKMRVGAFDINKGEIVYLKKEEVREMKDLMKMVRASSSMPMFMPITEFKGRNYLDGGIAGGVALEAAKKDGYKKYFVILTRPKGYRKSPVKFGPLIKAYYRKYPKVVEALLTRHIRYNQTLDELEAMEKSGKAFLVYPDQMPISNRERNFEKLAKTYELGYRQGKRDVEKWKRFLEK
ncbi:patatin-like phospholipase family protein [Isachenkonia alkalipeptolytica]|uniref:Patatin family protein n=1 Tax=Isachenkonia alkalipeptolytica TaxID=2565777 RepID=A0AA43XM36_9CLOT|nr:patatin family protein [Isachenkonia alkalipeptolytica]NBG88445.1 patatin family protein [Isachenkonia alkalipeptolytica]